MLCRMKFLLFAVFVLFSCGNRYSGEKVEIAPSAKDNRHFQGMKKDSGELTLFLCGDVMTGRGIDQALPHPGDPRLYESYIKNAKDYLRLAERENGKIPTPLSFDYPWKDALKELEKRDPDLRLINLETSITASDQHWRGKVVHYRMNPANIPVLTAAGIDGCALANNHVLDWGYEGLTETLQTLAAAGIKTAGAGENKTAAGRPAIWPVGKWRVLLFSFGASDSGVPEAWAAAGNAPGVGFLGDFSDQSLQKIKTDIGAFKKPGDVVIFSVHWGGNWGYRIPADHREFAHRLIDEAGVDLVHGHSSHHFLGMEVWHGKLTLYGCGDFFNDYEGIGGQEEYRGDLTLMYFPTIDPADGKLLQLDMVPLRIRNFRLNYVDENEAIWVNEVLNREGERFGILFSRTADAPIFSLTLEGGIRK